MVVICSRIYTCLVDCLRCCFCCAGLIALGVVCFIGLDDWRFDTFVWGLLLVLLYSVCLDVSNCGILVGCFTLGLVWLHVLFGFL